MNYSDIISFVSLNYATANNPGDSLDLSQKQIEIVDYKSPDTYVLEISKLRNDLRNFESIILQVQSINLDSPESNALGRIKELDKKIVEKSKPFYADINESSLSRQKDFIVRSIEFSDQEFIGQNYSSEDFCIWQKEYRQNIEKSWSSWIADVFFERNGIECNKITDTELQSIKDLEGNFTPENALTFISTSTNSCLKKSMYNEFITRGSWDNTNNMQLAVKIVNHRHSIALKKGYPSYANYIRNHHLYTGREDVTDYLKSLDESNCQSISSLISNLGIDSKSDFKPWSISELLKPYTDDIPVLKMDKNTSEGILKVINTLGKYFEFFYSKQDLDDGIFVIRVLNKDTNTSGTLIVDPYRRENKRTGAWTAFYQNREGACNPVVSVNYNFDPGQSEVSLNEFRIIFHELGHSFRYLFSVIEEAEYSGEYNVESEYIEFSSVFFERFLMTQEILSELFQISDENRKQLSNASNVFALREQISLASQIYYARFDDFVHSIGEIESSVLLKACTDLQPKIGKKYKWPIEATHSNFIPSMCLDYGALYFTFVTSSIVTKDVLSTMLSYCDVSQIAKLFKKEVLAYGTSRCINESIDKLIGKDKVYVS